MPADRFYTPGTLFEGATVRLSPAEEMHMKKVMRKKTGDTVELFNGQGVLFLATLKNDGSLQVTSLIGQEKKNREIIIAQSIISQSKLDWLTEKCAELGASSLFFFPSDNSEKKTLSDTLLERLKNIAIGAAKQSGRLFLMDIALKPPLKEWPTLDNLYFGSLETGAKPLNSVNLPQSFTFVVGPEKGFSTHEKALLARAEGLSLSRHTLRTETASLVLLSYCLQYDF